MFAKVASARAAAVVLRPGGRRQSVETAFNIVGHFEFGTGGWQLRLILKIGGGPSAGCKEKLDKKKEEKRNSFPRVCIVLHNTPPPL